MTLSSYSSFCLSRLGNIAGIVRICGSGAYVQTQTSTTARGKTHALNDPPSIQCNLHFMHLLTTFLINSTWSERNVMYARVKTTLQQVCIGLDDNACFCKPSSCSLNAPSDHVQRHELENGGLRRVEV